MTIESQRARGKASRRSPEWAFWDAKEDAEAKIREALKSPSDGAK